MAAAEPDDHALILAAKAGDSRAFRTLMQRYQRKIFSVAFGFLRNREDALDVVQEAFIKVHRHLEKFEGNSSFYTWLYRITANLCIDRLRRARRHKDVEFDDGLKHEGGDDAPVEAVLAGLSQFGDPSDMVKRKEILAAVEDALGHLSEKHRSVIVMRELQGMTYEEMAQAMECSKGTIMSRLFHARRNMQKLLRERIGALVPTEEGGGETSSGRSKKRPKKTEAGASKPSDPTGTPEAVNS